MTKIEPDFIARITLYLAEQGGRKNPIVGGWRGEDSHFRCPCKFHPDDFSAWDCAILNGDEDFYPGETKLFGVSYLSKEIVPAMRAIPKFYLWEGRIIGEASAHI